MTVPLGADVPDVEDRPPQVQWRAVVLLFTAAGIVRFLYFYLDDVTRAVSGSFVRRAMEEGTGAYAALLLFPLIVAVERRYPVSLGRWRRNWPVHFATFVVYSAGHTTLLALSRAALYPLLGHGAYDYGRMPVRYLMESAEDVITYCTLIGILTFMRVQHRLRDRDVRAAVLERDTASAQLEVLSLRLQPHFLFNALNTISSAVYDDPVAADEMIGRLGDLLRRALRTSERQEVPLAEELDTLRAYLTFVEARFGDRVRCTLDIDPQASGLGVPALLLQPLVENAVRHGAAVEYGESEILVRIRCVAKAIEIAVENDMTGPAGEPPRIGTGLGATRDRLRLLYGNAAELRITADAGRFRVLVRLPARPVLATPAPSADSATHARAHR